MARAAAKAVETQGGAARSRDAGARAILAGREPACARHDRPRLLGARAPGPRGARASAARRALWPGDGAAHGAARRRGSRPPSSASAISSSAAQARRRPRSRGAHAAKRGRARRVPLARLWRGRAGRTDRGRRRDPRRSRGRRRAAAAGARRAVLRGRGPRRGGARGDRARRERAGARRRAAEPVARQGFHFRGGRRRGALRQRPLLSRRAAARAAGAPTAVRFSRGRRRRAGRGARARCARWRRKSRSFAPSWRPTRSSARTSSAARCSPSPASRGRRSSSPRSKRSARAWRPAAVSPTTTPTIAREIEALIAEAAARGLTLVTTEKDYVRLAPALSQRDPRLARDPALRDARTGRGAAARSAGGAAGALRLGRAPLQRAIAASLAAGQALEIGGRQAKHRIGRSRRRPDRLEGVEQISSISVSSGSGWPSGGTPPMAKPVFSRTKSASARTMRLLVDALVARDDRRAPRARRLGAEDQRLGDLGHRAADRRRRVRRGARAGVEFQHLVIGAERGLDFRALAAAAGFIALRPPGSRRRGSGEAKLEKSAVRETADSRRWRAGSNCGLRPGAVCSSPEAEWPFSP